MAPPSILSDYSIYVTDSRNNRVMKWAAQEGVIVAGGNGEGNATNQLEYPVAALIDDAGTHISDLSNFRSCVGSKGPLRVV